MKQLTSDTLKEELWDTLQKLKNKKIQPIVANAVARQSKEIMTVVRTEMAMAVANGQRPSTALIGTTRSKKSVSKN